jgi:hypothetical protein
MNRAQRRKLKQTPNCPLCAKPMAQHDRVRFTRPSLNPDVVVRVDGHPKCVAREATRRAAAAEAAVANMADAAREFEAAQRPRSMGLWVPSQGAP